MAGMSGRDRDPFDDRPEDGSGWQEPAHLGGEGTESGGGPSPEQPAPSPEPRAPAPWEPPGWNLPTAPPQQQGAPPDPFGAQAWALQHGWTVSDGNGPGDAVLRDLLASAPVRPGKEAVPAGVLRGRTGTLDLVAFDIAYPVGRRIEPRYAVTAAPLLMPVPTLRLAPARFWKHRTGGLVPVVSGNEAFDSRWTLLAVEDGPQVRRLAQDPTVHGLLLGTDDGDEFWTAAGHVAAVRPDGHRPELIEHHARLLTAIVGALAAGY
jgi:hypothetical protein